MGSTMRRIKPSLVRKGAAIKEARETYQKPFTGSSCIATCIYRIACFASTRLTMMKLTAIIAASSKSTLKSISLWTLNAGAFVNRNVRVRKQTTVPKTDILRLSRGRMGFKGKMKPIDTYRTEDMVSVFRSSFEV